MIPSLLDLFLPRTCAACGKVLVKTEEHICIGCAMRLARTQWHRNTLNPLFEKVGNNPIVRAATAHFFYEHNGVVAKIIMDIKYNGNRKLGRYMGKMVASELYTTPFFNDVDVIIPTPLHYTRRLKRGYNQTELIAEGIAEITGIEVDVRTLRTKRQHSQQARKSADDRLKIINDPPYRITNPDKINGKNILLIDDVITTGSTINSIIKVILDTCEVKSITILSLASPS